jgi:hypothetical protein
VFAQTSKKFLRDYSRGAMNDSHAMKVADKSFARRSQSTRRMGALAGFLLFVALQAFAASGDLHKAIHSDANAPGHHCVITLLTHGQVNAPVVSGIWIAFVAALIFFLPLLQSAVLSSFDLRLSLGRAPPRF